MPTTFSTIDFPGAAATFPISINNVGQIVGYYDNGNFIRGSGFQVHGFLDNAGSFTTFDVPASPAGINDLGQIVGSYSDGAGSHIFVEFGGQLFDSIPNPPR